MGVSHTEGRQCSCTVNVTQQHDGKIPVKSDCSPGENLSLIYVPACVCVCVQMWQMCLKLSAWWPSLSISPDRAINCSAVPTEHVLANCEPSGSPFRQSRLLLFSSDSPHLPSPLSFSALFSLLYLSSANQSDSLGVAWFCFTS